MRETTLGKTGHAQATRVVIVNENSVSARVPPSGLNEKADFPT